MEKKTSLEIGRSTNLDLEHLMVTIGSVKNIYVFMTQSRIHMGGGLAISIFKKNKEKKTKQLNRTEEGRREKRIQCELTLAKIYSIVEYLSNVFPNK